MPCDKWCWAFGLLITIGAPGGGCPAISWPRPVALGGGAHGAGRRQAAFTNLTEKLDCFGSSAAVHTLRLVLVKVLRGDASSNNGYFMEMTTRRAIMKLILNNFLGASMPTAVVGDFGMGLPTFA